MFLLELTATNKSSSRNKCEVPVVTGSELEGHSFLKMITPSGKVYHFRDDATLVLERNDDLGHIDWKNLPFLTFGQPYGTNYYVQFPTDHSGFTLFKGVDRSGKDPVEGKIKIRTFAGPNKKRYSVAYFNYPVIREIRGVEDDTVNYLEVVFEYNSHVYAFTFSENGDELLQKENCTDSTFLTLSLPNGKVHKIKQSSCRGDEETIIADVSSLPYISFFHADGAKYDIKFPPKRSEAPPSIERDTCRDREKSVASILDRFTGPDGKEYSFAIKSHQPTITATSSEDTKDEIISIHFYNPLGQSVYYNYTKDGERIGQQMTSSAIGVEERPAKPFDVKNVELYCIQNWK